ncbi:MAG: UDP-3-O-(3-hydroxymyristoyl)glucosamine N-acyltransferase [Alphaproteobacteria bacterium]|nr:UDP-3-O-(3-hydroxymyristoyl)glucosamine N-acyltransferase [Alphaproteobacteria bacterium]
MADPRFYDNHGPMALADLAGAIGAEVHHSGTATSVHDVSDIHAVRAGELCYVVKRPLIAALAAKPGAVVLTTPAFAPECAALGLSVLQHADPLAAFARAAQTFYPVAGRALGPAGNDRIDPTARLGNNVTVEFGAVIGPQADIGDNTYIAANAVIGRGVCIGRNGFIGPNASVIYALLGDRVIVHGGVRIGSDGFGYASSPAGHAKIPQLGRVIVQDDVEIGANSCIDRGALGDTTIGEGTKIDNLVQIGHNDTIGRRVILVAQVGLSGSVNVGDWAVLGGKVGVADHVDIGPGTRVAAKAGVSRDLAAGQDYAGFPAQPAALWRREVATLRRLTKGQKRRDE